MIYIIRKSTPKFTKSPSLVLFRLVWRYTIQICRNYQRNVWPSGRCVRRRPDGQTFLCKFWYFQMAVSCLLLGLGRNVASQSIVLGHVVWGEKCGQEPIALMGSWCGLDNNPKIETIFLNFYRADFVSQEGILWAYLWDWPLEKKQFKIFAFASTLIGQVKQLIWIQTDIIKSEASGL